MYLCVLGHEGEILLHRHLQAAPEPLLKAIAPYRDGLVVAGEWIFTWYWLAALCAQAGLPLVLGQALSMKASPGGKAKNDKIESHTLAALLRGGMLPKASGYPADMRAPRDVLRRRTHLMRTRAELLGHVHHTNSHSNLPEIGKTIADKANREGVAERLADPAVHQTGAGARALLTSDADRLTDLKLFILTTAKQHAPPTLSLLHPGPGMGKSVSLVWLSDIHHIERFPSVQEFASSCRLVNWSKDSGGKRLGTAGKNSGNAPLTWAFAEAATLFVRNHPQAQKLLARWEKTHDQGNALSLLAHNLGRAVSLLLKRRGACEMEIFLQP